MRTDPITTLGEAIGFFEETYKAHPERDAHEALVSARAGRPRRYPIVTLNHLGDPADATEAVDEIALPEVRTADSPEGNLARELMSRLTPLKMLNPIAPCIRLGKGPGSLVPCFGIPLNPEAFDSPAYTVSIDEALDRFPDDVAASGILPETHERIDFIRSVTPDLVKIEVPDLQGPFNLVHAIVGEHAMLGPYTEPDKFKELMRRMTDFWIAARTQLVDWIGPDRLWPAHHNRICECSVNLVSADFYMEHIFPEERRAAEALGKVHIHPCSGPHVFKATLEHLPNVVSHEAGHIEKTAAGCIEVDEALELIGERPIALGIGQEVEPGNEYEFVRRDLERYLDTPRLTFSYTGMHWRKKDRPHIRDIHRRLDRWWEENVAPAYGF